MTFYLLWPTNKSLFFFYVWLNGRFSSYRDFSHPDFSIFFMLFFVFFTSMSMEVLASCKKSTSR